MKESPESRKIRKDKNRICLQNYRSQESNEAKTSRMNVQKWARIKESPEAREKRKYWNKIRMASRRYDLIFTSIYGRIKSPSSYNKMAIHLQIYNSEIIAIGVHGKIRELLQFLEGNETAAIGLNRKEKSPLAMRSLMKKDLTELMKQCRKVAKTKKYTGYASKPPKDWCYGLLLFTWAVGPFEILRTGEILSLTQFIYLLPLIYISFIITRKNRTAASGS
jgi:hypothetical protein